MIEKVDIRTHGKSAMSKGFIKLMRGKETEHLMQDDPAAFKLLTTIAMRANRDKEPNSMGLKQGEAMVGDYRNYGLSRQEYRGALLRLRANHPSNQRITIQATNRGTIAKLVDNSIYDINIDGNNQRSNHQTTNGATTNKNIKNKEVKNNTYRGFVKPTIQEVAEYAKSINFDTLNARQFVDYYEARGWKLSRGQPMQNWKACVRTWEHRRTENNGKRKKHRADTEYEVPAEYADKAIEV